MKIPKIGKHNRETLIEETYDPKRTDALILGTYIRRNIYLGLFVTGFICTLITALMNRMTLCILSLFLATISLVVMTKYDTYHFFLKILKETHEHKDITPDHS